MPSIFEPPVKRVKSNFTSDTSSGHDTPSVSSCSHQEEITNLQLALQELRDQSTAKEWLLKNENERLRKENNRLKLQLATKNKLIKDLRSTVRRTMAENQKLSEVINILQSNEYLTTSDANHLNAFVLIFFYNSSL